MEVVLFIAELGLGLALGFVGGFTYHRYRYWKIKRHAPSAKVVSFHVALSEEDYQRLPKTEEDVGYYTPESGKQAAGSAEQMIGLRRAWSCARCGVGIVRQFMQRWWAPLLAVLIATAGACLTAYFWDWIHGKPPNAGEAPSATIRNAGLVIAAPVALVLAVWRSIVAQEQADTVWRSLQEERYQKAAEMLGSDLLPVRLGGIDGLCRLARDYPREFHLQVLGLLSAYVRYPPPIPVEIFGVTEDGHPRTPIPREEVQKILEFLGGRTARGREIEKAEGYIIDINGADLSGVVLQAGSNLEDVHLINADLTGAFFTEVKGLTQDLINGAWHDPSDPAIFLDTEDAKTGLPFIVLQKA